MELLLSVQSFFGAHGATWMGTLLPLALLAVVTSIIIHTTILILGRAFSLKEIENYAISEMLQAVSVAFIAIFLVVIISGTMELANTFIAGSVTCGSGEPIQIEAGDDSSMDSAYEVIRCRVQTKAKELADIQGKIQSSSDIANKFNLLNLGLSLFGIQVFSGNWVSSIYKEVETYRIINTLATNMLISLNVQSQLLEYLRNNMINIFIPVGILMRSFYFTRAPGALLISLGIGMYFVFPVFYVLLDPGFVAAPASTTPPAPQTANLYCYPTMSTVASVISTVETAGQGSSSGLSLSALRNNLAKYYVDMMIHPLICLFLTMVFIRYLMSVLGGDTYELTKMVTKVI